MRCFRAKLSPAALRDNAERRMAFAMAMHPRLGRDSPAASLQSDIAEDVLGKAGQVVNTRPHDVFGGYRMRCEREPPLLVMH